MTNEVPYWEFKTFFSEEDISILKKKLMISIDEIFIKHEISDVKWQSIILPDLHNSDVEIGDFRKFRNNTPAMRQGNSASWRYIAVFYWMYLYRSKWKICGSQFEELCQEMWGCSLDEQRKQVAQRKVDLPPAPPIDQEPEAPPVPLSVELPDAPPDHASDPQIGEKLRGLWQRYRKPSLALASILVLAIAGYLILQIARVPGPPKGMLVLDLKLQWQDGQISKDPIVNDTPLSLDRRVVPELHLTGSDDPVSVRFYKALSDTRVGKLVAQVRLLPGLMRLEPFLVSELVQDSQRNFWVHVVSCADDCNAIITEAKEIQVPTDVTEGRLQERHDLSTSSWIEYHIPAHRMQ